MTSAESSLNLPNSSSVYFVVTQKCGSHLENQNALCSNWASEPRFPYSTLDYCAASEYPEYRVGGRIANSIGLQKVHPSFDPLSLWPLLKKNEQLGGLQSTDYVNMALPIGKLYIHCAPCKCQIATAMNVAFHALSAALWAYVRVDYRLTTSCSSNQELERMTLLQDDIRRTTMSNTGRLMKAQHMDLVWLDQTTMELEDEIPAKTQQQPLIEEILSDYTSTTARRRPDKKCCGVVIVGELGHIQPLMQGPRFPKSARMPRETEIWEMNYADRKSWCHLPLGSFTPSNFK
jgi:hypothetical protein